MPFLGATLDPRQPFILLHAYLPTAYPPTPTHSMAFVITARSPHSSRGERHGDFLLTGHPS